MKYRICNANSSVSLTINNKKKYCKVGEGNILTCTAKHKITSTLYSLIPFYYYFMEKKRRNRFTIFLQKNFYPKKKMASWLSGFVDARCKIL